MRDIASSSRRARIDPWTARTATTSSTSARTYASHPAFGGAKVHSIPPGMYPELMASPTRTSASASGSNPRIHVSSAESGSESRAGPASPAAGATSDGYGASDNGNRESSESSLSTSADSASRADCHTRMALSRMTSSMMPVMTYNTSDAVDG